MLESDILQYQDDQQQQHGHKEQGGDGVDLRADPLLGHGVDGHGQGGGGRPGGKVADDEVVDAHGEGGEGAGDDARLDLGEDDLPERLEPGAAQVLGCVDEVLVQLPQFGPNGQNHIGDIKGDVGQQQRDKAKLKGKTEIHLKRTAEGDQSRIQDLAGKNEQKHQ